MALTLSDKEMAEEFEVKWIVNYYDGPLGGTGFYRNTNRPLLSPGYIFGSGLQICKVG